jgi:hypothetical protein
MIKQPIIILGAPRSGTTLLYTVLSQVSGLYSTGQESKNIIEKYHHPSTKNWASGELTADDLTDKSKAYIQTQFHREIASADFWRRIYKLRSLYFKIKPSGRITGVSPGIQDNKTLTSAGFQMVRNWIKIRNTIAPFILPAEFHLLDKSPEHCLRLSFLNELFPDAKFIYLIRDGRSNISSLMQGWRHPTSFPGYDVPIPVKIPRIERTRWAFTLIPGWQELISRSLVEVCAAQWLTCNSTVIEYFQSDHLHNVHLPVKYEELIHSPEQVLNKISEFMEVDYRRCFPRIDQLPVINAISSPDTNKWKRNNGDEIEKVLPAIELMQERLGYTQ